MKFEETLSNAVLTVEENSHWNEQTLKTQEIDELSVEQLRDYARNITYRFVDLGYELHKICEYIRFCQKYKLYVEVK